MPLSIAASASAVDSAADGLISRSDSTISGPATATQILPKAKEFESILLGQWLQGAESSFGSVPGGDEDQDAGDEQMTGFGVQQLSKALSNAGGIGLAKIVADALARQSSAGAVKDPAAQNVTAAEVHR